MVLARRIDGERDWQGESTGRPR
uniref:Uncharacterized protein n=1 Tax=Arundo donax TaxID=35708 RepID=A0A0A9G0U6_ARUDO